MWRLVVVLLVRTFKLCGHLVTKVLLSGHEKGNMIEGVLSHGGGKWKGRCRQSVHLFRYHFSTLRPDLPSDDGESDSSWICSVTVNVCCHGKTSALLRGCSRQGYFGNIFSLCCLQFSWPCKEDSTCLRFLQLRYILIMLLRKENPWQLLSNLLMQKNCFHSMVFQQLSSSWRMELACYTVKEWKS